MTSLTGLIATTASRRFALEPVDDRGELFPTAARSGADPDVLEELREEIRGASGLDCRTGHARARDALSASSRLMERMCGNTGRSLSRGLSTGSGSVSTTST